MLDTTVRKRAFVPLAMAMLLLGTLWTASPAEASHRIYRPTRFDDPPPNGCRPRNCSLREAILAANNHGGKDTIVLKQGTYELTRGGTDDTASAGDLDVLGRVTVRGAGPGKTRIRQTAGDRIFEVLAGKLTVRDLTIRGGNAGNEDGGGIMVNANTKLTVRSSRIVNNHVDGGSGEGGGIYAYTPTVVKIIRSLIKGNSAGDTGGGIDLEGTSTIRKTTVKSNTAGTEAGGVENLGTMTIKESTISKNAVQDGVGGGIWNQAKLTVINSTISGNKVNRGGGGIAQSNGVGDYTRLVNSTIARNVADRDQSDGLNHNGGGIFSWQGAIRLTNTIVADNIDRSPGTVHRDCSIVADSVTLKGGNLIEKVAGCPRSGAVGKLLKRDPKLLALQGNGGPTKTHALQPASKAVDAATRRLAPARDQRGVPRDRRPDLGAYELV